MNGPRDEAEEASNSSHRNHIRRRILLKESRWSRRLQDYAIVSRKVQGGVKYRALISAAFMSSATWR
jgi:hypothetical protein